MSNKIKVDTSLTHDYNTLFNRFEHKLARLDTGNNTSQVKSLLLPTENVNLSLEFSKLITRPPSIAASSSRLGTSSIFHEMAEKLRPQHQISLTPPESPTYKPMAIDVTPYSNAPSSDIESLELATSPGIKDLLINAEGLLSRLQNAYVQRTSALNEMTMSRDNLVEELEESNVRAQNLQSQLAILANTLNIKDQRIAELEQKLSENKSESLSFPSTSQIQSPVLNITHGTQSLSTLPEIQNSADQEGSSSEEYMCNNYSSFDFDPGNESDYDSSTDDSIFSRPRSPALTTASSITTSSPNLRPILSFPPLSFSQGTKNNNELPEDKPKPQPHKTFFGFLTGRSSNRETVSLKSERCTNCLGENSKAAWDTAGLLRAENQALKGRIVELENAMDSALDAIMAYY